MPNFRFHLETLRKLRRRRRDELRRQLAQAEEAASILAGQQSNIAEEERELAESQRRECRSGMLDVNFLLQLQRRQMALKSQSLLLQKQIREVEQEVERRRTAVVEADRQVKALDKLENRKLREFRKHQAAVEVKRLDEIGSIRRGGELR